jgi:hypothetical protein
LIIRAQVVHNKENRREKEGRGKEDHNYVHTVQIFLINKIKKRDSKGEEKRTDEERREEMRRDEI